MENRDIKRNMREELANILTHGLGFLLSVIGLTVLVAWSAESKNTYKIVSVGIFGSSLVLLYGASTLYHASSSEFRRFFKLLDHIAIYLLIAGSYTPFALVTLRGPWGWSLLGIIWGLALLGIVYKIFFIGRFKYFSTICYVLMGWTALVAIQPLIDNLGEQGFAWIVAGGFAYSAGVIFFLWERLPYHHSIWHLFVMGGSACHFVAVLVYV
ncbi:MAG: hemolysin III family protein [Bernardetiaceae bacterium]|nr:hemolysin III family protein [Bernardetiaceae bacterium]